MRNTNHSTGALELFDQVYAALCAAQAAIDRYNALTGRFYTLGYSFPTIISFESLMDTGDWRNFTIDDLPDFLQAGPVVRKFTRAELLQRLGRESSWRCPYCGLTGTEELGPDGRTWHLDHGYPKALGGDNRADNMILACATCNVRKNAKTAAEVFKRIFGDAEGRDGGK